MFVYKITNKENNKVYIGQSIRPIEHRFERHINDAINNKLNTHFARAIRKYGADKFYIECIDTASTQEELNKKEQYWIRYYDSINTGYNETDALYKCGGNTYKSKTDKELEVIGKKISLSKLGNKNPNAKPVKCFNIETLEELVFNTVKECQEYFKEATHRFITTRCLHKVKSPYKGFWKIAYVNDEYGEYVAVGTRKGIQCSVIKDDIETKYSSIRSIERDTVIQRKLISQHIQQGEQIFIINDYKFILD